MITEVSFIVKGVKKFPVKCDICGKRVQFGHSVSHSKRHTKRRWLPNIHRTTIIVEGEKRKVNICTRCLRTQYKAAR